MTCNEGGMQAFRLGKIVLADMDGPSRAGSQIDDGCLRHRPGAKSRIAVGKQLGATRHV
ncbi:hypothetical protein L1N85_16390 [Paenibacillus alkaliterrae]|uniref:hypothetical protein n=1 Tax=Paenibacillus alkaliterrae TaxID=320909 RepID=UPI001F240A0B|nr:hypothetical protein [Paenibacillus alkaliterrae]MCF2939998.1 hypothetical protein [Paenibacillus alkaliterrae]